MEIKRIQGEPSLVGLFMLPNPTGRRENIHLLDQLISPADLPLLN